MTRALAFLMFATLCASPAAAGIYECRDATGRVAFQDKPCARGQAGTERKLRPEPEPRIGNSSG